MENRNLGITVEEVQTMTLEDALLLFILLSSVIL